jgi:16S rRNA (uracil1498-N3)-methyltransferase
MSNRPIRLHVDALPGPGAVMTLPEGAARHAQVRRVQPGDALHLFDGCGREHVAQVASMGRRDVTVTVGPAVPTLPELPLAVTLAVGVPTNERMDALVEKATELGVAAIQPLWTERAVLRLDGERAERRRAHWQAVAVAASEQSGRTMVPEVTRPVALNAWLADVGVASATARWMLDFADDALSPAQAGRVLDTEGRLLSLSGPEGGLSTAEREAARRAGFQPVSLGPRVLRADTAPLALLAWLGLRG